MHMMLHHRRSADSGRRSLDERDHILRQLMGSHLLRERLRIDRTPLIGIHHLALSPLLRHTYQLTRQGIDRYRYVFLEI
jgi:hypothetical protein